MTYQKQEVDHRTVKYEMWIPTQDIIAQKIMGKFLEEGGESISAVARALIQGIDGKEPTSGKPNRVWVEDELADLWALMTHLEQYYDLDLDRMAQRTEVKYNRLSEWFYGVPADA